ncbi:hypothetical protein GCM10028778_18020 [Barrientosiimonas marina]|uniref:Uncharacterized protein n=2 Tax=Lentibacillus TaxID=175304 RepID=A0A5S3QFX3_9BACI|nr:hypothetical protein [Lentibacillus cibarius]TMN20834.1 hypothetical protein FFL34_00945 [Lentibacillus cibarius]
MTDVTDTKEFENILNKVDNLACKNARSLLKIIYGFVNTAMTGNGGDNVKLETLDKISKIYKDVPDMKSLMDGDNSGKFN